MNKVYEILVNGKVVNKVQGQDDTPFDEFVKYQQSFDATIDPASITVREYNTQMIAFRTNAWMQTTPFAIEVHLKNLLNTYGEEAVYDVLNKITFSKVG